jgi:anti-sigma regulatory factor (Ser/Thr protein kinase)
VTTVSGQPDVEQVEEIKLTLPALVEYARVARLAVTGLASRMGFSYDEIEDLRIAVGEVCGILLDGSGGRITFRCTLTDEALEVSATRHPVGPALVITDMTTQILAAVADEADIDPDRAHVRLVKRRQD